MILFHELSNGGWFILSVALAFMFGYISVDAWMRIGYRRSETKAAIALTTFFTAEALARFWSWLLIWLPAHGYYELGVQLSHMLWWPIIANLIGMAGALCAVRVFYPMWTRRGMFSCGASWMVPLLIMSLFLVFSQIGRLG